MTTFVPMVRNARVVTTTIVSGQKNSDIIDLADAAMLAVVIPAAFTGTTLTLLAAPDPDSTFVAVKKSDGTALTLTVAPSTVVTTGDVFYNLAVLRFIKLVSGSNEGADRVLSIITK